MDKCSVQMQFPTKIFSTHSWLKFIDAELVGMGAITWNPHQEI